MLLHGKKIGILGMARSGGAAALKSLSLGAEVFISDNRDVEEVKKTVLKYFSEREWELLFPFCEFGAHTDLILNTDLIVVSPGVPKTNTVYQKAFQRGLKVIGEIEFAYLIKHPRSKIIAVTGSNGKSTTVSLIYHILKDFGFNVVLGGNIGQSFSSFAIEKDSIDYIVLELSSFQLEDIHTFKANTAALLNITPDHLDRYNCIEDYLAPKLRISSNQTSSDILILNGDDNMLNRSKIIGSGKRLFFYKDEPTEEQSNRCSAYLENDSLIIVNNVDNINTKLRINLSNSKLFGQHNRYNIMAAILAVFNVISANYSETELVSKLEASINSFTALPHRLELVRTIDGVRFVNDSKATNTDSVKYALSAFNEGIHLIIGGYDKGEDYSLLSLLIAERVKGLYLIGATRDKMSKQFSTFDSIMEAYDDLESAVKSAYSKAKGNEVVLLAPACASFDMFADYEHRGEVFRSIVRGLR